MTIVAIRNKEESNLCSGLYIVPTPIGNLRDMTLRALDVLTASDIIVCEDSRVTGKLLAAYGIKDKKKLVYNDHADEKLKTHIINLAKDNVVALVSDAGSPLISDPGYKLVRDAISANIYVTALPGANALLPAIQLSGMPSDGFTFYGFLPTKDKAVRDILRQYHRTAETLVFYESPKRIEKTISIIGEIMINRKIAIIREISKVYEEVINGNAEEILNILKHKSLKGEIVLVIHGAEDQEHSVDDIDNMIKMSLAKGQSVKELSSMIASMTSIKKKDIYNRAISIQNQEN
jgi:16S rRNA (cytidine1402-2'-O)-methyltransferase